MATDERKRFESIKDLVNWFGSRKKMAQKLGVTVPAVDKWIYQGHIPAWRALQIDEVTDGMVGVQDIRHLVERGEG